MADCYKMGVNMGKVIFFAFVSFVVLVSLCFGQEGLLKTEAKPSLMYSYRLHSEVGQENFQLQPLSFYASYKRPHFNSFITNALIMQAEGESLQPKTPFWKQAGIYGLEFLGGSGVSILSTCYVVRELSDASFVEGAVLSDYLFLLSLYVGGGSLLQGATISQIGRLFNQNGSWVKSSIGSCIGSIMTLCVTYWYTNTLSPGIYEGLVFGIYTAAILPPTLGVIGYNW